LPKEIVGAALESIERAIDADNRYHGKYREDLKEIIRKFIGDWKKSLGKAAKPETEEFHRRTVKWVVEELGDKILVHFADQDEYTQELFDQVYLDCFGLADLKAGDVLEIKMRENMSLEIHGQDAIDEMRRMESGEESLTENVDSLDAEVAE